MFNLTYPQRSGYGGLLFVCPLCVPAICSLLDRVPAVIRFCFYPYNGTTIPPQAIFRTAAYFTKIFAPLQYSLFSPLKKVTGKISIFAFVG
jgi:hypothetical protein